MFWKHVPATEVLTTGEQNFPFLSLLSLYNYWNRNYWDYSKKWKLLKLLKQLKFLKHPPWSTWDMLAAATATNVPQVGCSRDRPHWRATDFTLAIKIIIIIKNKNKNEVGGSRKARPWVPGGNAIFLLVCQGHGSSGPSQETDISLYKIR